MIDFSSMFWSSIFYKSELEHSSTCTWKPSRQLERPRRWVMIIKYPLLLCKSLWHWSRLIRYMFISYELTSVAMEYDQPITLIYKRNALKEILKTSTENSRSLGLLLKSRIKGRAIRYPGEGQYKFCSVKQINYCSNKIYLVLRAETNNLFYFNFFWNILFWYMICTRQMQIDNLLKARCAEDIKN